MLSFFPGGFPFCALRIARSKTSSSSGYFDAISVSLLSRWSTTSSNVRDLMVASAAKRFRTWESRSKASSYSAANAIRVIQVLPGHAKLENTALYVQVATDLLHEVTSPLDRLPPG
jgi:hypothetical protein